MHAGEEAQIEVVITATDPAARVRLAGLKFAEQAATELSGGRPLRARVDPRPAPRHRDATRCRPPAVAAGRSARSS